jgi:hypothetical protein
VPSNICIWCLQGSEEKNEEHIIPEALGCPSGFVLPGTIVCRKCNNGLSHLDSAVIDDFDFSILMAGIKRKKGRLPEIRSRGNVIGTIEREGPVIFFNMDPIPTAAHDGSYLAPYKGSNRNIMPKITKNENLTKINFEVQFGQNRKFLRGIVKIAFSSLAYFLGANIARSRKFSAIRNFVRHGKGERHALIMSSEDSNYLNRAWPPYITESGDYVVALRLASMEFLIDLSEDESQIKIIQNQANKYLGNRAWYILPS